MAVDEQMRFQGINPTLFVKTVSDLALGGMVGNSMAINVLQRLFVRLLPAAQLVPAGSVHDEWVTNEAFAKLAASVDKPFKEPPCKRRRII